MSYDPSHRRQPPRQGRWPDATPPEAWQAYREDDAYQGEFPGRGENQGSPCATAAAGYRNQPAYQGASGGPAADPGYRGYPAPGAPDPFAETYAEGPAGYGSASDGYGSASDGYGSASDGYGGASDGYAGRPGGYPGYDSYVPRTGGYDQRGYGYDDAGAGHGEPQDGFDGARVGQYGVGQYGVGQYGVGQYGTPNGYAGTPNGYAGAPNGYAGTPNGYQDTAGANRLAGNGRGGPGDDYFPGDEFAENDFAGDDFAGSAGYPGRDDYAEPGIAAPDAGLDPQSWQAGRDRRTQARRRGLIVGAMTGFLAAAAAIGASTLAAAFVRPQASPLRAADRVFIDRTPAALKNAVAAHFGAHAHTVLLLGMYLMIGVLALAIGVLARRAAGLGVAGVAALSLGAAFLVITRTGGQVRDVIPSIVGGLAGVAALLWLRYASAPVPATRHARDGGPRRAR
jgi:hypothetical protein